MTRAIRKHVRDFVALAILVAIGVGTAAYILNEQGFRAPLISEDTFDVTAAFTEAGGVKPGQNQAVRIAGVRVGEIGNVELEDGRAILSLEIEARYAGRLRSNATALLRPRTGLEDMFVELDPGTPEAPPMREGGRIEIGDTLPDVDSEDILNQLDGDTRSYLKLLINGGGAGLKGRSGDLRDLLRRLEPLHRDVARVNGALARQRRKLARLVHDYGQLMEAVGREDEDLERLVASSRQVFGAFASQRDDIEEAVGRLPEALRSTEAALLAVDPFARELGPALTELRPAFARLDEANAALRSLATAATPAVRDEIRPFVRAAQPYVATLRPAARDLARATPDLTSSLGELNRLFNMASHNPNGAEPVAGDEQRDRRRDEGYLFWLAWVAHNSNSLFSTSDANGPFRRTNFAVTCDTLRELVAREPLTAAVMNVTELLADTGLCPSGGGAPTVPLSARAKNGGER
jgi:phospholipid/cholesterol/gamma-HCH transport system substrate-binding protein